MSTKDCTMCSRVVTKWDIHNCTHVNLNWLGAQLLFTTKEPCRRLVLWIPVFPNHARRITEGRAWQVIGMWRAGWKQTAIAHHIRLSHRTVSKLIHGHGSKYQARPWVSIGRPKKTLIRDDRLLYHMCSQDRLKSTRYLRDQWQRRINLRVSCGTVNRMLLSRGPSSRRPAKKTLLTCERKTARLEWAPSVPTWPTA